MLYDSSGITFIRYPQSQHVTGITFIRYPQNQKMGKPNNSKVFWDK
jgi:hypothetical protein